MSIMNNAELTNTQAKLKYLEARYESRCTQPTDDPKLREASLKSLKSMIDQFKSEIAQFNAAHGDEINSTIEHSSDSNEPQGDECSSKSPRGTRS